MPIGFLVEFKSTGCRGSMVGLALSVVKAQTFKGVLGT